MGNNSRVMHGRGIHAESKAERVNLNAPCEKNGAGEPPGEARLFETVEVRGYQALDSSQRYIC